MATALRLQTAGAYVSALEEPHLLLVVVPTGRRGELSHDRQHAVFRVACPRRVLRLRGCDRGVLVAFQYAGCGTTC
jgi:hypothetical protein